MKTEMTLSDVTSYEEYEAWWEKEARPVYEEWLGLRFFADLKNGQLSRDRLCLWLANWYNHVQESDLHRPVLWSRHHHILGRYPQLEEIVTERGGKPLKYPYPGGHRKGLEKLATTLEMSHSDIFRWKLRPQTIHLTSYLKSLYLEGTLAEFASQLIAEEYLLKFCEIFQGGLSRPPFSFKGEPLDYFKYWNACFHTKYGSPGRFLLKSLFEKGLVEERPNFGLKHVGRRYGDYLIRFYQEL